MVTSILGIDDVPDYYSEGLQLRQFNENGKLQSLIKTTRLLHYPDQQEALLQSPELLMFGVAGDIWKVTSSEGKVSDSSRNFTLYKDVILSLLNKDMQQKVIIKTTELHYNVSDQTLWTDAEVEARSANGNFVSRGLQINIKSEQIILKDKVRMHYDI